MYRSMQVCVQISQKKMVKGKIMKIHTNYQIMHYMYQIYAVVSSCVHIQISIFVECNTWQDIIDQCAFMSGQELMQLHLLLLMSVWYTHTHTPSLIYTHRSIRPWSSMIRPFTHFDSRQCILYYERKWNFYFIIRCIHFHVEQVLLPNFGIDKDFSLVYKSESEIFLQNM